MTSTTHSLVAISIAASFNNPLLAFPLSFFSNYLLDMIPHWDFGYNWRKKSKTKVFLEGLFDVSLSYFLVLLIRSYFFPEVNLWYMLACVFLAQLPDWLELPYLLFDFRTQPFAFFYQIQHFIHRRLDLPWGLTSQIIVCFPLLYLILR